MAATLKQLAARNDAQHYIAFLSARLLFNADTQSVIQVPGHSGLQCMDVSYTD